MFDKILRFYTMGVWDEARVRKAVEAGKISESEYERITGKKY